MKITTNNVPRPMRALMDVPEKHRADFDYIEEEERHSYRLIEYKGGWYDVFDTQRIEVSDTHTHPMGWAMYVKPDDPLAKWDCVLGESFFSGVLFKLVGEDEVICGGYYS